MIDSRFGERMSDVKKEAEKRTTRYLDRTSSSSGGVSSLVNSNKIVSRKQILANKSLSTSRSNDLHRYSHTHGQQNPRHHANNSANSAAASNSNSLLNGCHPMLDRSKHKRPNNPEIMKRTLR